jgi:hypothetical protein
LKRAFTQPALFKTISFSRILTIIGIYSIAVGTLAAKDYTVSGTVTDISGMAVPNAKVSMLNGSTEYYAVSGPDGNYSLRISGIYGEVSDMLELGTPHPNPFTFAVNIPFIINSSGDIRFSVYSFNGQKIKDILYPDVSAGSYRIIWDGCNDNGSPVRQGIYIYAITFKGKTWSSKIIKSVGYSAFSSATTLEPVMLPPVVPPATSSPLSVQVITKVNFLSCQDHRYYNQV